MIEKDGKYGVYFEQGVIDAVFDKIGSSNPNPDTDGAGTFKPDFEELLKDLKGAKWEVRVDPEKLAARRLHQPRRRRQGPALESRAG